MNEIELLKFEGVLEAFRQHKPILRASKSEEYLFIYQQIPAKIDLSIVPKMTSVPDGVKSIMEQVQKGFNYQNQAVKVDKDGNTTYWIPTNTMQYFNMKQVICTKRFYTKNPLN